jgi:Smg protein
MRENVLDVLVYLFEHFIDDEPDGARDRESMQAGLVEAGFEPSQIHKAFDWLDALERVKIGEPDGASAARPFRVYAEAECARLDRECRGFLTHLEHEGVLDAAGRELVLDRAFALEDEEIDLDDLKWVVLMVLFSQPGREAQYAWMEGHLLDSGGEPLH